LLARQPLATGRGLRKLSKKRRLRYNELQSTSEMARMSRVLKIAKAYRARMISLVMLPAFFFGSLPQTACICAGGHREPRCQAMACGVHRHASSEGNDKRSCCQGKVTSGGSTAENAVAACATCCCNPIAAPPPPTAEARKLERFAKLAFKSIVSVAPSHVAAHSFAADVLRAKEHVSPPVDRVIVLLHLTI
jgi:hypothetical protein